MRETNMEKANVKSEWYHQGFDKLERDLNGQSKTPLHAIRKQALCRFDELGFPTTRHEEWRFTNVSPIRNTEFKPVLGYLPGGLAKKDVEKYFLAGPKNPKLVFVDGHFAAELSHLPTLPSNCRVGSLASAMKNDVAIVEKYLTKYASYEENAFTALSTAFIQDGAFILIGDDIDYEEPIECLFVVTVSSIPKIAQPRNLIVAGKNSRATFVETYVGLGKETYLTNGVTEIIVGENAVVEHDKLQMENEQAFHIGSIHVQQSRASMYTNNSISLGGLIVRSTITVILADEGCESTLNGLSLGAGDQLIDNHTVIDHTRPHCASHELYKSVLDGRSKGVFNGKIFVRKDAQKTDAKQTNKTLLLSDDATIDTKPQLEIFADDVKCTHGATVGQLDDEQVFYLRSRGIGESAARDILTFAFASDVVNRVHSETLKNNLYELIHQRLEQGRVVRG
jgi:Fe-S cluster assembly protein SufD